MKGHKWKPYLEPVSAWLCCRTFKSSATTSWSSISQSVKNNEAKEIDFSVRGTYYMKWMSSLYPLGPCKCLTVKNSLQVPGRAMESDAKSSDWLFPLNENSVPAGRCCTLLICTWFHGPEATPTSLYSFHSGVGGGFTEWYKWHHVCSWEQLWRLPTHHHDTHPAAFSHSPLTYQVTQMKASAWRTGVNSFVAFIMIVCLPLKVLFAFALEKLFNKETEVLSPMLSVNHTWWFNLIQFYLLSN